MTIDELIARLEEYRITELQLFCDHCNVCHTPNEKPPFPTRRNKHGKRKD